MAASILVRVEASVPLITAFALLNIVGHNAENGWEYSHVRARTRSRFMPAGEKWRNLLEAEGILATLLKAGGAVVMDIVPLLMRSSNSEDFSYLTAWQNESRQWTSAVGQWLERFSGEEGMSECWPELNSEVDRLAALLGPVLPRLEEIAKHFREPTKKDSLEIVILPNPLDIRARGYSISSAACTWIFLGPVKDAAQAEAICLHELLHRWVDPEAERMAGRVNSDPMPILRARYRVVAEAYSDFAIWLSETVVRAFACRLMLAMAPAQVVEERLVEDERQGFAGVRDAYELISSHPAEASNEVMGQALRLAYEAGTRRSG